MEYSGLSQSEDSLLPPVFRKGTSSWKSVCFWVIVAVPFICIPILFSLFASIDTESSDDSAYYLSTLSIAASASLFKGSAVSVTGSGEVRVGGGTTIYRDVADISPTCPKYIDLDAIFESYFISSYSDKGGSETSTLQLIHMDAVNKAEVVYETSRGADVYEIVTLSQSGGTFIGVEQDMSFEDDSAFVFAGRVLADASKFSLGQQELYSDDMFSLNPAITRLTDTSFAMSYYASAADGSPVMSTRVGTIDDSLQITLSDPIIYTENTDYSAVHEVVGIGSSHYILAYYLAGEMNNRTADPSAEVNAGGPLLAQLVKFTSEDNTIELVGTPVEYLSSSPAYYLSAANIDDETAVLVFADRSINYGILSVLVAVDSVYGVLQFGSSLELSTGQALGAGSSAVMDLDVTAIPPSDSVSCGGVNAACTKNSFAVLYSDATNDGLMTVVTGKVSPSSELIQSSPEYVIKYVEHAPRTEDSYAWGAMAALSNSQVGILTAATDGTCTEDSVTQMNMMEVLPKPFGIVKGFDEDEASVLVSGEASVDNAVAGVKYYTTTMGEIVSGNMYYGQECSVSEAVTYVDLQDDHNVILSLDSFVGTGISSKKILVAAKY